MDIAQGLRNLYDNIVLLVSSINDISTSKADKVVGAISGDIALLDNTGNLMDQGYHIENSLTGSTYSLPTSYAVQQLLQEMTTRQIVVDNTTASKELDPNILYIFNNRTSDLTITLGTPQPDIVNEYHLIMSIGDTAPTITWPAGITWPTVEPEIYAYSTLEVSIINNVAMYVQY